MSECPPKLEISRDEIRTVYAKGEEVSIELVESPITRINSLEDRDSPSLIR
jgi:hypothetical protein